jgi:hypothetical protein
VREGEEEQCWESSRAACPKELQCMKEGLAVCLDPVLRCDMHPQCDGGEDEKECEAEYRRRGYLESSATMKCESPHHNSKSGTLIVTIWATPCDGREECFQGWDERGCDTGWIAYVALSKKCSTMSAIIVFSPRFADSLPDGRIPGVRQLPQEKIRPC